MSVQTMGKRAGDVFLSEGGSPAYTRESKTITNAGGTDMVLAAGYPMDDNVPVLTAGIAGTDGLLLEPVAIPAGESRKVAVVARGQVVVNFSALPTVDYAGDALVAADVKAAIVALGFIWRAEPTKQLEQTN